MRGITVAAALCFATACGTDPAVAPPSEPPTPLGVGGPAFVSASCVNTGRVSDGLRPIFNCGDQVHVKSLDAEITPKIPGAIAIWGGVLGRDGLPRFVTGVVGATPWVTLDYAHSFTSTSSTYYCAANPTGRAIAIYRSTEKADCGKQIEPDGFTNATQFGGLSSLIAHELSHTLGFKHLSDKTHIAPAANHCVASLPVSGLANGSLCQAEIEELHYIYGLRDSDPDQKKHFASGFEVSGPTSLTMGQPATETGTFTVQVVRFAAPFFTAPAASTLGYSWRSSDPTVATVGGSSSSSNTVKAVKQGSTTIHITLTSTDYEKTVPFTGGDIPLPVIAKPAKPTGLAASAVTHSSATIRWVNGATDAGTTTTLQHRQSGTTTWTTISGIAAGATTRVVSGLSPLKTYDVRVFHVRSGLNSDTTTSASLFTTTAVPPPPAITNFQVTNCERRPVGTKTFGYYAMGWTSAAAASGYTLQIGEGTTSTSAGAAVILTLASNARSAEVGGYLVGGASPTYRWFWIRYVGNGVTAAWAALVGNPLAVNQCLQL